MNLEKLVERAIQQTRKVESEAQEEKKVAGLPNRMMTLLFHSSRWKVGDLVGKLLKENYPEKDIINTLESLSSQGRIGIFGALDDPNSVILY